MGKNMSVVDFNELTPEAVLEEQWVEAYKHNMDFFFNQFVRLNTSLFFLGKLAEFPISLLVTPDKMVFHNYIVDSLYEKIILGFTRLLSDSGTDLYPFQRFKNEIGHHMKPEYQQPFWEWVRAHNFDTHLKEIVKRLSHIRNHYVAHLNKTLEASGPDPDASISLSELKQVCNAVNELYDAISFSKYYFKTYIRLM
jgi:hypothetical protein